MDSRERLLTAIHNDKPDRLPCQVHSWMQHYLDTYLDGRNQFEAYACFPGMDWVIYAAPRFDYREADLANWQVRVTHPGPAVSQEHVGSNASCREAIETPGGTLTRSQARNVFTTWITEYLIRSEENPEIWDRYSPLPERVDWTPVIETKAGVEDRLFFIGGFDQNAGFEQGTPEVAAQLVRACHAACPDGGYICSPSDHFFHSDPANVRAFAATAAGCTYG